MNEYGRCALALVVATIMAFGCGDTETEPVANGQAREAQELAGDRTDPHLGLDLGAQHGGPGEPEMRAALEDPETAQAHVDILARHVPVSAEQRAALAANPAQLAEHLDMLAAHRGRSEEELANALAEPAALQRHIDLLVKHGVITAEESRALADDPEAVMARMRAMRQP